MKNLYAALATFSSILALAVMMSGNTTHAVMLIGVAFLSHTGLSIKNETSIYSFSFKF